MTQTATLTRVGNSKGLIIPSRMLKMLNISENSILNISCVDGHIIVSKNGSVRPDPVFPKVKLPELAESEIKTFLASLYEVPCEEIVKDERLEYILNK